MKTKRQWMTVLILLMGISSNNAFAMFESREQLFRVLYEKGFDRVVEIENKTYDKSKSSDERLTPKEMVVDLASGNKVKYSAKRLPEMDYIFEVVKLRQWYSGSGVAKAYSVSGVMVCYYIEYKTYAEHNKCYVFPKPIDEIVAAISS